MGSLEDRVALLEKKLEREKKARLQAEEILENKSRQLYDTYTRLKRRREELEKALNRLQEAQSQLVQSEKMASVGTIAAGVAHEINNPLSYVVSNVSTLRGYFETFTKILQVYRSSLSELPEPKHQELKEIETKEDLDFVLKDFQNLMRDTLEGMMRVKEIVQGLKTFARVDEAEMQEADINECIENTLKVVWNEIKYKCNVEKDLQKLPLIKCYPGQLNQVFMNLIVNASQAIEGKGKIGIFTRPTEKGIEVRVADTGKGIKKEDQDKIFTPFFTTKPVGKGTGLGLSVSYGVIEKHGGRIGVESEVGKGTVFKIFFPFGGVDEAKK